MREQSIDIQVLRIAIEELRPVRRQVFALFIWEAMTPVEIVDSLANQGVVLNLEQVQEHICAAARHCERRLNEFELNTRLAGACSTGEPNETICHATGSSEHIWLDTLP